MSQIVESVLFRNVEKSFRKLPGSAISIWWLSKFNQFSLIVYRLWTKKNLALSSCLIIFMSIPLSVQQCFCKVVDGWRDRQTNAV